MCCSLEFVFRRKKALPEKKTAEHKTAISALESVNTGIRYACIFAISFVLMLMLFSLLWLLEGLCADIGRNWSKFISLKNSQCVSYQQLMLVSFSCEIQPESVARISPSQLQCLNKVKQLSLKNFNAIQSSLNRLVANLNLFDDSSTNSAKIVQFIIKLH